MALPADVYAEIERLIASIVIRYVDPSNPALHFDELMAECRAKLARLIHDGRLERCPTRAKFFAFLKTAFKNHVFSLLQKHIYCFKRSGIRSPTKRMPTSSAACGCEGPQKAVRISLDDPDSGIQIGSWDSQDRPEDLMADFEQTLSPMERLVLHQLVAPNDQARRLAEPSPCKISNRHLAEGLGMPHQLFVDTVNHVRMKCREFINAKEERGD